MADNRATLKNPTTGDRQAVEIGGQGEQDLMGSGYQLEGPGEAPAIDATYIDADGNRINTEQMIASGQTQEDLYGAGYSPEVNLYESVYGQDNLPSGAISSSLEADTTVGEINGEIKSEKEKVDEALNVPEYKEYTDHAQEIEDSRDQAKSLLEKREANIEADFKIREYEQRQSNRVQTGFASKSLARMGSYGNSMSGMDYMKSVQVRNEQEINKLLVQKQQLLISAEEAFVKNDWTMLSRKISESKAITDQYNKIQTWQFEDSMKSAEEADRQQKFGWEAEDRAMEKISTIAYSGIDFASVSPGQIKSLMDDSNLSRETVEGYFNLAKKAKDKKGVDDDLAFNKELWNVLSDVPAGQIVEIGGKFYTGTKDADLTLVTDSKTGIQYAIRQNSDGTIEKINLGIKGKGQPPAYSDAALTKIGNTISSAYADGSHGGECGAFVHNIISTYPYGLNTMEEKNAQIDPNIGTDPEQSPPQIGDVVIQSVPGSAAEPYGHVSVINSYDPETGIMTLTESNFGAAGQVSNTRSINITDKSVNGFYRGNIKPDFVSGKVENPEVKYQTEFDDYMSETIKNLAEEEIDWEEAHSRIYRIYKDDLDALAAQSEEYSDGRLLLDDLLGKTNFVK